MKTIILIAIAFTTLAISNNQAFAGLFFEKEILVEYVYNDNGELDSSKTYKNQRLISVIDYGKVPGFYKETIYGFNGNVISITSYIYEQKDGIQELYDPNGKKRSTHFYFAGVKHLDQVYYNDAGEIWRTDLFDEGKMVATTSVLASLRSGIDRIQL